MFLDVVHDKHSTITTQMTQFAETESRNKWYIPSLAMATLGGGGDDSGVVGSGPEWSAQDYPK